MYVGLNKVTIKKKYNPIFQSENAFVIKSGLMTFRVVFHKLIIFYNVTSRFDAI